MNIKFVTAFREIDRNAQVDITALHNDCVEMFAFFNMKIIDSLVKCTKYSLDLLKRRATTATLEDIVSGNPLMKTRMELHIPITLINPSLDEIHNYYNLVLNNIINTHKDIVMWGQRGNKIQKTISGK